MYEKKKIIEWDIKEMENVFEIELINICKCFGVFVLISLLKYEDLEEIVV